MHVIKDVRWKNVYIVYPTLTDTYYSYDYLLHLGFTAKLYTLPIYIKTFLCFSSLWVTVIFTHNKQTKAKFIECGQQ